jgi:RNA polymerase sigma factor (sigma-70 family)
MQVGTAGEQDIRVDGDEASFESFYRAEYAAVVRLAFTLTGRRDLAEELAQDGFLAAHRNWAKVSAYESPSGWVRRVVSNRCVSSGRRHLTGLRLVARLSRERAAEPALSEGADELWAMVRKLPKRQAQVLALAFLEDRSIADMASILGCGEETIRTHLRRGREAMADRLERGPAPESERTR